VERYDDGMPENVNKWDLLEAREKGWVKCNWSSTIDKLHEKFKIG
jgi:hypothetical protein